MTPSPYLSPKDDGFQIPNRNFKAAVYCRAVIAATLCFLTGFTGPSGLRAEDSSARKPAILFCAPTALGAGNVDLTYLRELQEKGFEVDYTTSLDELTWERVRPFNVLLLYAGARCGYEAWGVSKMSRATFNTLVERFLQAGGGVFLFVPEYNVQSETFPPELMERWGMRIAAERIREKTSDAVVVMERTSFEAAYTDQILPSPVSADVKGFWYPFREVYNAQATNPLWISKDWQAVARGSPTTITEKVDFGRDSLPLEKPFYFPEGRVTSPVIFAVRAYSQGRLAAISQWPQFSIGSGTKWLFDRIVLSRGLKEKPSDFGRLLENTFRWLAEPSLPKRELGGFVTVADKLLPPNDRPAARKGVRDIPWYEEEIKDLGRPSAGGRFLRGLIGAKTTYSSGQSTVEEYAIAAKRLGLAFVVVVDDFDRLTPKKLEALRADCVKFSDDRVQLLGGFTIESNIGNRLFCFGPTIAGPPANCLTGPDQKLLAQQGYAAEVPVLNWLLTLGTGNNAGYYDFNLAKAKGAMRMRDCRTASLAAVRYYRDGKLVEDLTDEFLVTAQSTFPPGPVSFNEVRSVAELEREVRQGHALTCARVESLKTLFAEALRWTNQYDGPNLSVSDGPQILAWPACHRVITHGAQDFVTGHIFMPARIVLRSDAGLKEARIYNGRDLFRRFILNGAKEFDQLLRLEGAVQKNLVLIVEDLRGGKAVSYARRCWKDGGDVVVFCSDHVNDCKSPGAGPILLAHGPFNVATIYTPQVLDAGETWDGGPEAAKPLLTIGDSAPVVTSNLGKEEGVRFRQTPLLEFADEGAAAVASARDEVYDAKIVHLNPWHTYGPTAPARLFEYVRRFRAWTTPTLGPPPVGWTGPGMRDGIKPTLSRWEITFKPEQTIADAQLLSGFKSFGVAQCFLAIGRGAKTETIDLTRLDGRANYPIGAGEWFGVFTPEPANGHLFFNRGGPIVLEAVNPKTRGTWFWVRADLKGRTVKAAETLSYELACLNFPFVSSPKSAAECERLVRYLEQPAGLELRRSQRVASFGLIDLRGENFVADFTLPNPKDLPKLTLPFRVQELNPRWSAGLWLKEGYEKGDYGKGRDRYTPLGLDAFGYAYVPVHATWAERTSIAAGHPVVADARGREVFIQVTHISDRPRKWHVSANNPTDQIITTKLTRTMDLPGLKFAEETVTLKPGEYREFE